RTARPEFQAACPRVRDCPFGVEEPVVVSFELLAWFRKLRTWSSKQLAHSWGLLVWGWELLVRSSGLLGWSPERLA
ncbi:MAG: hypothetical protein ACM3YE_00350, partial [Bacteroidota bacterium]